MLAMQGCLFSSGGGNRGGQANHGYYAFTNPTPLSSWSLDSSYQVQWTATGADDSDMAILTLYKGDTLVGAISSYQSDPGSYLWSLSLTRTLSGYRLGSGTYRLRVTNALDTTQWDYSPTFTIYSPYTGKLELTSPTKGTQAKLDSTLRITWTKTGNVGSYVGLQLLKDTVVAYNLTTSVSATTGSYSVSALYSSLGSGDDYHIRIYAYSDPSITQTGPAFTITSIYSGSFEFTSPGANDTLTAGMTAEAAWDVTGNPGSYAQITLWHDSTLIPSFSYSVSAAGGSYLLNIPAGLSTGRYRLRLTSSSDAGIFAFSPAFFVRGADPDEYEKDDSLSLAKTIATDGKAQEHTLTLQDMDWMVFKAKAGKRYLAGVRAVGSLYLEALDSAGRLLKQQYGTNPQLIAPAYVGTEYLRVRPYSSGTAPGAYQVSLLEYDSSGLSSTVAFTAPDAKATWASGSYYNIMWTPDSVLFGTSVNLMLYNDTSYVQSISTYAYNTGTYSWTVPSNIYTGSKYRIRMVSSLSTDLFAYSPYFTISGLTPDTYEPDNSRGTAKSIPADGTVQNRNITVGDSDWVSFDAIAGKTYLASASVSSSSSAQVYLYVTDSLGTSLVYRTGSRVSATYTPTRSGKFYLRIQGYSGSGAYSLSLVAYDANQGLPARFTTPDSSTVWSAGSYYSITWKPDSVTFGPQVILDLFNDSAFVQSISTYLSNTGTYSWTVPSSLYSGGKYRIRMSSYSNTTLYGFSPYFSISGLVPDAYEPDNSRSSAKTIAADGTLQQRNLVSNDSDWVRFDAVAGRTYLATANSTSANMYLYMTDSVGYSLVSQYGLKPTAAFTPTRAGKYYLRVQPYSGTGSYTLSLISFDPAQGGVAVKFTNPDSGTVWSTGTSYLAAWVPDTAVFGAYVTLGLYQDNTLLSSLSSYNSNTGSATISVPSGLATGKNYRVRLTSYSNSAIYGSSAPFTISGIAPDSLEPNDSVAIAKTVDVNTSRMPLSLSYRDKDWMRFTAHAQKMYVFEAWSSTSMPTYLRLWNTAGTTILISNTRATLDTMNSFAWVAPADGDYFISVEATSTSYYGDYGFDIKEIDPAAYKFTVSAPAEGAAAKAGSLLSIAWSDPSSVKGYVDLFLYDADGVVATIAANASNVGSYSWSVPAGTAARSDYYVKVISRLSSSISGVSGAFSITP